MRKKKDDIAEAREEIDAIRGDLESGLHTLRKRQLAAIEKARASVDRRKAEKIRKSIDEIGGA